MRKTVQRIDLTAECLPVGILPPQPTLYVEAIFGVPLEKFLAAVRLVLPTVDPKGGPWHLDGHKSNRLFLQKTLDPSLGMGHYQIDLPFGLEADQNSVKLSFFGRDGGAMRIFSDLRDALTQILPRFA